MSDDSPTHSIFSAPDRALLAAVVTAVLLFFAATWVPGPAAWGLNHLAYLPIGTLSVLTVVFGSAFVPGVGDRMGSALGGGLARWTFESRLFYLIGVPLFVLAFVLLGRSNHFLGDGAWLAYAVQEGEPFHFFDFCHYHLHYQIYHGLGGSVSGLQIYRWSSILAGLLAVVTWRELLRRLSWESWQKSLAFILLLMGPPALLFFGYLESYAFSFVFLTAFLLASMLVFEGRLSPWIAGAFFGAAWFFHLGVVFSAPALWVLVWRAPTPRSFPARLLQVGLPALAGPLVGALFYLASGYDAEWFRREFLNSSQGGEIFVGLTGDRGLVSATHWKDLINTAALTGLVPIAIVLASIRRLGSRIPDPTVQLLVVHLVVVALIRAVVDAKLGGAKDWDLVVMHSASLPLLAVSLLRPPRQSSGSELSQGSLLHPTPRMAAVIALASIVVYVPWVLLQSREDASLRRLIDVTVDAPAETETFVLEHVARIYREQGDLERARPLYAESVRRAPGHLRLRFNYAILLLEVDRPEEADRELAVVLDKDPNHAPALEVAAARAATSRRWEQAFEFYSRLCEVSPERADHWQSLAGVAFQLSRWEVAAKAYDRGYATSSGPRPLEAGMSYHRVGRHDDAAEVFRSLLREGGQREMEPVLRVALAGVLIEAADARVETEPAAALSRLEEADRILRSLQESHPDDSTAPELLRRIRELREQLRP